jgi:hypothetical protein
MTDDREQQLAMLAAYHVGLFAGTASRHASTPAAIAHALFLLIEEAKRRREEWLAESADFTLPPAA